MYLCVCFFYDSICLYITLMYLLSSDLAGERNDVFIATWFFILSFLLLERRNSSHDCSLCGKENDKCLLINRGCTWSNLKLDSCKFKKFDLCLLSNLSSLHISLSIRHIRTKKSNL
ncbi:hypothetical protein PVK06_032989 [Gossypium arboreum]|uniref:Uncharacterized protein n=1 Tax=Gossypium arboreum TaxID=29729 RepID=A0ABR0NVI8_GOSAR|nr:hypothetical protein PVK06_032989 [Gossypium arboreum]